MIVRKNITEDTCTTLHCIQNSPNKSLETLFLSVLQVPLCTYVFLFISLFCLKNKLCGFIQCLFRICRDVGNRKLIRFELRFLIRWIWFSKQVITMRISALPFDLEFSILNHLWALRINLFKVDETISFGGDDVSVTT